MKRKIIWMLTLFLFISFTSGCSDTGKNIRNAVKEPEILNKDGMDILTRYNTPEGYVRVKAEKGSFGYFIRHEKLKKYGTKALYYNGKEKPSRGVYDSVFDVNLENKNILHCADACFKFKGDYLYSTGKYDKIKFRLVGNGVADYSKYREGYRLNPENGTYRLLKGPSDSYEVYKKFMDMVYGYCSTISLVQDTHRVPLDDMQIGDMFVRDGTPGSKRVGHAIMVVDVARDKSGNKMFMLAQSYMPAQQPHILVNLSDAKISPWYSLEDVKKQGELRTPQWTFKLDEFRRYNEI